MRPKRSMSSHTRIFAVSLFSSCLVLAVSLIIQWLVYDDWLHHTGPLRIVGTVIAAVITLAFMLRWQYSIREQQREMIRRFELVAHMNDRIRNALQVIECVTYVAQPEATETVKREVNAIDRILRDVLLETRALSPDDSQPGPTMVSRKSA
jgi:hypothetical protein